jgi:hypothetical protein
MVMGLAYNGTTFTQNFVKIDKIIQKLKRGKHTHTHTQYDDLIYTMSFLKEKNRLLFFYKTRSV